MIYRLKESLEFRLNFYYVLAQGLFWMSVCCTISLGSAYLTNRGYSTIGIGALFATAYLLATVIQQVVSVLTDNSTSFDVVDVLAVSGLIFCVDLLFAIGTSGKGFATGFTFLIAAILGTIMQPFINALNFHIEKYGVKMNFGVARASGSFFFFIMSLIAGNAMKAFSEKAAPVLGFIVCSLFTALMFWINKELKGVSKNIEEYDPFSSVEKTDNYYDLETIKNFIDKYKMFFLFLIGLIGFYFSHVLINNFLFQIVVNVGGDEADTGGLLALQAIVELPAMIFFFKLKERFSSKSMLIFSAVFFFVKIFATTVATSVGMLYFSMIFQAFAFAIFVPASVHFVDEIMEDKDAVKGQAFITIAMTLGNLFSSIIGGIFIRAIGVVATLWLGTFITLSGVIVTFYALLKIKKK